MKPISSLALFFLASVVITGCTNRAARTNTPAGPVAASQTQQPLNFSDVPESWTKPEPGWLYVLDPKSDANNLHGRVWLVDPESSKIMGNIRTGSNPDFAISPDGSQLYIASQTDDHTDELVIIDTSSAAVIKTAPLEGRVEAKGIPSFSSMAVSGDGLTLRILVNVPTSPTTVGFQLASLDTQTGTFLPGHVHLGNCGYGRFVSYPDAGQFDYLCPTTNRIRFIRVDARSRELANSFVVLPWPRRLGVAEAFPSPDGQETMIVRGDGAVFKMDVATQAFSPTIAQGDVEGRILPASWPTSPDGSRIYLGYSNYPDTRFYLDFDRYPGERPGDSIAGELQVFDTTTWRRIGAIKTSKPIWSAVSGNAGRSVYALSPGQHAVLVIDAARLRQTRMIPVGVTPAIALVAPGEFRQAIK